MLALQPMPSKPLSAKPLRSPLRSCYALSESTSERKSKASFLSLVRVSKLGLINILVNLNCQHSTLFRRIRNARKNKTRLRVKKSPKRATNKPEAVAELRLSVVGGPNNPTRSVP